MNDIETIQSQFTFRAAITGIVLGALLVPCNVYSGLKIGWSFNMSIAAALLGTAFWTSARGLLGSQRVASWGILENNVNQTCASSAASIISAGLVAPIPALTILTGKSLSWPILSVWLFVVSAIGVLVALSLRRQMLLVQQLPFPSGVATAETLREIHAQDNQASKRTRFLVGGGLIAAGLKSFNELVVAIPQLAPAIKLTAFGLPRLSLRSLGFALDPSFLMVGFGAIVGLRVGWSLLLGAVVAWGLLTPWLFYSNRLPPLADVDTSVYGTAVEFLLWPGVGLMVSAALVSFAMTLPAFVASFKKSDDKASEPLAEHERGFSLTAMVTAFVVVAAMAVLAQALIFEIHPAMGLLAVVLTFGLAIVAARVSGETGIPPIGALGKITQLTFGFIHPTNLTANLMTANVTGGAAGQCSDLLHDLKAGQLIGAAVRVQGLAQLLGVITGSLAGSAAYLVLVPDPAGMLLTQKWPAPAVATWKAVAELFQKGIEAAPPGAITASIIGCLVGLVLANAEGRLSERRKVWCPSAVSVGLAFVIPAFNSISLFLGALLASITASVFPLWSKRYVLPIAAGLVAGESLAGVATALAWLVDSKLS